MVTTPQVRQVIPSVGVTEASALWIQESVEAGDKHIGGMRTDNASLTRLSTSPGESEDWATARSMPQVVAMTRAAGMPLSVASLTTRPSWPPSSWKRS
jgi:hypothetical protein